jgi:hypothetical protein
MFGWPSIGNMAKSHNLNAAKLVALNTIDIF